MEKPLPKQDLFKGMMHVSPFASFEPDLIEAIDLSTPQEYDLGDPLHLCEGR
jgi:hypothetical protein